MTNEELVVLIQAGERDRLPQLWAQVERFVAVQAHKRLVLSAGLGGVEFGDLYNAGYLALVAAVDSFDPDAGRSFVSWLALALKKAFAEAGGYRSRRQARDPLHHAGSLDAPVSEDGDGTLGEFQADPAADEGVYKETVRQWQEKGLRTLRRYRVRHKLNQFVEERTPYFASWGADTILCQLGSPHRGAHHGNDRAQAGAAGNDQINRAGMIPCPVVIIKGGCPLSFTHHLQYFLEMEEDFLPILGGQHAEPLQVLQHTFKNVQPLGQRFVAEQLVQRDVEAVRNPDRRVQHDISSLQGRFQGGLGNTNFQGKLPQGLPVNCFDPAKISGKDLVLI